MTREGNEEAASLLRKALDLDADFGLAAMLLALVLGYRSAQGWATPGANNAEIVRLVRRSIAADPHDPEVLATAGRLMAYASDAHEEAAGLAEQALALGPASASTLSQCGWTYVYVGRPDRAIGLLDRAVRSDPLDPMAYSGLAAIAHCHIELGQDEAAIATAARAVEQNPNFSSSWKLLAAAQALAGRADEAAETVRLVLERYEPGFTLSAFLRRAHFARRRRLAMLKACAELAFPNNRGAGNSRRMAGAGRGTDPRR
jgi:adenylate cyclase